ncbi:MAG: HlyD family efflux transporter periplasmic adaptor subunit [Burkholderiales bacterium]|nr:HlyD family efflux transporter periplasmic adaptor subunit [Burkholderiales bacterium]
MFRKEALQAKSTAFLGSTVLRPPLSFAAWSAIACVLAAAVIAFLFLGDYTKRTRVVGITAPAAGVIKLMAPQPGIVVERHAEEGQVVKAGDVLFVLSTERLTGAGTIGALGVSGAQGVVLEQIERRRASLVEEQARQGRINAEQTAALQRRLADLDAQAAQIDRELATQRERVRSAQEQLRRYEDLQRQQFMSELAVQQKREELLDQTSRLQTLERARLALRSDGMSVAAELKQLPLRGEASRAELERQIAALAQDSAATEANRQTVITAPQDGTVTAILAERGQMVGAQPLATLLPKDSQLEAHLYAPSRAVGFVEQGQEVRIRYAAYPYQKFGQYAGEVTQVSRSALSANELPAQLAQLSQQVAGEGLYRITVALGQPSVNVYGKLQPLSAGMQLEADVLQDTRSIIEWVFDPIASLRGRL